jgi:hypothetical protein
VPKGFLHIFGRFSLTMPAVLAETADRVADFYANLLLKSEIA